MRIDLPQCNLKTCRYQADGNCVDRNRFETCEYTFAKEEIKRLKKELEYATNLTPKICETCKYEDELGYEEPCNSCNGANKWELKQ